MVVGAQDETIPLLSTKKDVDGWAFLFASNVQEEYRSPSHRCINVGFFYV